jgi:hypothetical protein
MGKIGNRPYKVERNSTLEKRATDGRPYVSLSALKIYRTVCTGF